jgi:hypothetical protein
LFVLFIILLCGYGLYALLAPPAELYEESETNELFPELKISSFGLPDYSKARVSGKEE